MANQNVWIKDVLGSYKLKLSKDYSGDFLPIEKIDVRKCKVDKKYQRGISPAYIRKGGALDLRKLVTPVIARRPNHLDVEDQGDFVIDGQHRCVRVCASSFTGKIDAAIVYHPETFTLEECIKEEASLFHHLNTLGKKPTKLDEVRAGIYAEDPKSLHILDMLETFNLTIDNLGSEKDNARQLEVFTHFHLLCLQDYPTQVSKIRAGFELLDKLYDKETTVKGDALRAFCLLAEFIDALTNGKKIAFEKFVRDDLPNFKTLKALTKGRATGASAQFILYDIIGWYNDTPYAQNNNVTLGTKLLDKLSNKALGGNSRFAYPAKDK